MASRLEQLLAESTQARLLPIEERELLELLSTTVVGYCITSNHTHVLASSESEEALSQWMQQVEGEFAQSDNRRKHRSGAFWSDRCHRAMIKPGPHLWNGMVYIDLNMVRAGVVTIRPSGPGAGTLNGWASGAAKA